MIDYKYSALFKNDNVDKQFIIATDDGAATITNTELHQEQFELNESICSESTLRFGSCEASSVKFRISNIFTSLKGKWITISCVLNGNTDEPFIFGRYKVNSDKPTADKRYRDIVAYDSMYDILTANVAEWYNSLALPMSLKTFRNAFISHFNLEEVEIDLPNDEMTVERTIEPSEISGRDVLTAICEINGCFGHIGRDEKFQYVFLKKITKGLYPSAALYPSTDLFPRAENATKIANGKYIKATYEDYLVQSIDKVQIRQEENDIGGSSGDGDNAYIIEDNFLVYGKSTEDLNEIAANFLSVTDFITYRPTNVTAIGNPCLEVGDAIKVSTKYQTIESYILNRTIKGIQGLKDTYVAKGEEYFGTNVNSVQRSIIQLKGKTNVLIRTVEETQSTITNVERGLQTQITQNAGLISAEAIRALDAESQLSGRITLTAESFQTQISGLGGEFSLLKQAVDGFTFQDENGETKISGDTIKTGLINGITILFVEQDSLFWACGTTDIGSAQSSAEWVCDSNALYCHYNGERTVVLYRATGNVVFSGTVIASDVDIGYSVSSKISEVETVATTAQNTANTANSTANTAQSKAEEALAAIVNTNEAVSTLNGYVANLMTQVGDLTTQVSANESGIALNDKSILGLETRLLAVEEKLGL